METGKCTSTKAVQIYIPTNHLWGLYHGKGEPSEEPNLRRQVSFRPIRAWKDNPQPRGTGRKPPSTRLRAGIIVTSPQDTHVLEKGRQEFCNGEAWQTSPLPHRLSRLTSPAMRQSNILHDFWCALLQSESHSVMSHSLWPHGLHIPWYSPGQNTGVGSLPFSRGSSQPRDQPRSPTLQTDSLPVEPQGKPKDAWVGSLSLLQQIFLTQELNQSLLHCRQILYQLRHKEDQHSITRMRFSPKMRDLKAFMKNSSWGTFYRIISQYSSEVSRLWRTKITSQNSQKLSKLWEIKKKDWGAVLDDSWVNVGSWTASCARKRTLVRQPATSE